MDRNLQEGLELLEDIEHEIGCDQETHDKAIESLLRREEKMQKRGTIDEFHLTELRTRRYKLKEARRRYEGELRAFTEATKRHDRG